jgi:hypothetical protein
MTGSMIGPMFVERHLASLGLDVAMDVLGPARTIIV